MNQPKEPIDYKLARCFRFSDRFVALLDKLKETHKLPSRTAVIEASVGALAASDDAKMKKTR